MPRWLSSIPTVEEVQLCLHQAQRTGQGPEILCQWARHSSVQSRLRQSLVQLRLRPHPASLVSVPACALASATLLYPGLQWGPSLEPVLGWTLVAARAAWLLRQRGCCRERTCRPKSKHKNERVLPRNILVKLH